MTRTLPEPLRLAYSFLGSLIAAIRKTSARAVLAPSRLRLVPLSVPRFLPVRRAAVEARNPREVQTWARYRD